MNDFQVTWELAAFVIATIGGITLSGVGILQFVRIILTELLSNPAFLKLIEGAANSVPVEEHQRVIDFARSVDEGKDRFLRDILTLLTENIDMAVDLAQEAFDGVPADTKPK